MNIGFWHSQNFNFQKDILDTPKEKMLGEDPVLLAVI